MRLRDAVFSECGTWRYQLSRVLRPEGSGPVVSVNMVNPSRAGAEDDDPTITKVRGFGVRLGWNRFLVGNKFAFTATDVAELRNAADPVGPRNMEYLTDMFLQADLHVVAWGPLAKLPPALRGQWRQVATLAELLGVRLYCWGVAKDGHPRHPLMIAYDTPLVEWTPP